MVRASRVVPSQTSLLLSKHVFGAVFDAEQDAADVDGSKLDLFDFCSLIATSKRNPGCTSSSSVGLSHSDPQRLTSVVSHGPKLIDQRLRAFPRCSPCHGRMDSKKEYLDLSIEELHWPPSDHLARKIQGLALQ